MLRTPAVALVACTALLGGCFTSGEGREPRENQLYYPTGLVVSPGGTTLYVANSDFDLQYSGGSVLALDLELIRDKTQVIAEELAKGASAQDACNEALLPPNDQQWLHPGPCYAITLAPFKDNQGNERRVVRSFAFIGAFASGIMLAHNPDPGEGESAARLFVPVRGDPSITYFEVSDDRAGETNFELDCLKDSTGFCNEFHRLGQDPSRTLRGVQLPADPVGIASTADGVAIVSAHQTESAASLTINDWTTRPELVFFTSGLAAGPTEVAAIPEPAFVSLAEADAANAGRGFEYQRGFAITFRASSEVDLLRFVPDSGAVPPRPFLTRATALPVDANQSAFDSRGIVIIDSERRACEASCSAVDVLTCLAACAEDVPLRVFMANRAPASLVVGQMDTLISRGLDEADREVITSATEDLFFYDSIPLNFGPSRVEVGSIINEDGVLEERIFAVAFDSRTVFMFDPIEHRMEAVIRTGRGPHDIAFDVGVDAGGNAYAFLHIGHFTDSYIGIVDLDRRRPLTYAQMFATVGVPVPPKESQ